MASWLIAVVVLLAFANGSNDNFKGVSTLFGSGTTNYRRALVWATATTLLGSLVAFAFAARLARTFGGKGLVPDSVVGGDTFMLSVGAGAGLTVLLATRLGFPISTTHALAGALAGASWLAAGSEFNAGRLGTTVLFPLLLSPLIAFAGTAILYPLFRWTRSRLGVTRQTCVCALEPMVAVADGPILRSATVTIDETHRCANRYGGRVIGVDAQQLLDSLHYLSAGAVSFARGLNDTPKIMAIVITAGALSPTGGAILVGAAMAIGGWVGARRVAETMSHRVTTMNHGQGFTANLVTAGLVTVASRVGVPVSTTHVSCGSLFGLGASTGEGKPATIFGILLAWVTTLPLAALIAGSTYLALR